MSSWKIIGVLLVLVACGDDSAALDDAGTDAPARDTRETDVATDARNDTPSDTSEDTAEDTSAPAWTCSGSTIEVVVEAGQDILGPIETAAASANDGDCLVLPVGEFVAQGTARITKMVSVVGRGASDGGTWIRRAESYPESELAGESMIYFDIDSRDSSGIVLAGIRFSSKTPQVEPGDGGSLATDFGVFFSYAVDFVVTDCTFENFGYGALRIRHFDDLSRALIYNNTFTHNYKGNGQGLGYGVVVYGEDLVWVEDPEFGSDNFIFIENNRFTEHRHSVAAGGAARYVARHNEIIDNVCCGGAALDAHEGRNVGPGGSNHFATRAVEVYDNILRNESLRDGTPLTPGQNLNELGLIAIGFRGGEQLCYNNTISGYLNGILLIVFDSQADVWDDNAYPYPYQIGWQSGDALGADHRGTGGAEGAGDFFEWNNTFEPYAPTGQERKFWLTSSNQLAGGLVEGRDYHLDTPKPGYVAYVYPHPARIAFEGVGE